MTSTSTYQGMNVDSKPSSRVLAPPGGGSSNIFGSAEPVKAPPKKETAAPTQPAPVAPAPQANQGERFVRAAPKQAFNPITGQPYDLPEKNKKNPATADEDDEEKEGTENKQKQDTNVKSTAGSQEKTSTRIAQPPGGKSTPLW